MIDARPSRVSAWWLLAPGLLFALNFVAALVTSSTTANQKDMVYDLAPIITTAVVDGVLIGYCVFAVWISRAPVTGVLAMRRTSLRRAVGLSVLALVLLLVSDRILEPLTHAGEKQGIAPTHSPSDTHQWVALAVAMVALVVVAPLAEEIMFRGLSWEVMGRWALPGTAAFWAIAHGLPVLLIPVFVAGLIIGELRRRTDSLWPGLGVHMTTNGLVLVLALLTS